LNHQGTKTPKKSGRAARGEDHLGALGALVVQTFLFFEYFGLCRNGFPRLRSAAPLSRFGSLVGRSQDFLSGARAALVISALLLAAAAAAIVIGARRSRA